MKLTQFKALTLDCYGTLIDWERGITSALRPWIQRHKLTLSDDEILAAFARFEPRQQAATPEKLYPDILAAVYLDLGAEWKIPTSRDEATAFAESIGSWPAFADSAQSLQYLKRHYKLVILSNVDRASFAESNKKLGVTFDRIITAQDVGSYKPDARNFEHAINALAGMGVEKGGILHTAQSLFHDIVPAKTVGLKTMWVNRRKGKMGGALTAATEEVMPDFEVASLGEFVILHQAELRA